MNHNSSPKNRFALCLGGGAIRGFSHIGVLRFLEENDFFPSEISGTSMGAVVAALFSLGKNSYEIRDFLESVRVMAILDFIPNGQIMNPKKIIKKLRNFIGNPDFSHTKIPLKIVAVCLHSGQEKIFTQGKIIDAIMASISLPWLLPPYKIGRKFFIDGGVRANLPLLAHDNIPIVASSVTKPFPFVMEKYSLLQMVSLFEATCNIILVAQEDAQIALKRQNSPVCLIRTAENVDGYLNFRANESIFEVGYTSAVEAKIADFFQKIS